MSYLIAIILGLILGLIIAFKIGFILYENEKAFNEAQTQSAVYQAQFNLMQEIVIDSKREKEKAYNMFFQVAEIATRNMQQPTQLYPKPLPSLSLIDGNSVENAVYTPSTQQNAENVQVGEGKHVSNLVLKTGVKDWLLEKGAKLFEGKNNVVVEIEKLKYVCDYSQEKGTTNKISTLPLHLGKCLLPACNANFISHEKSSKYCCDQHKNQNNNNLK